jgi:hypothetical protein
VTETYNPGLIDFDVQYIGQSIGNDGTRNFLDRVKNHEKLQQIYVDNENNESKIGILAFKVSKDQTLISIIPPSGAASSNILEDGFNLMENLTIEEIVTLFEASFIKYFRPKYNKYFKDNFPSSNMKCLRSLYGKDFFGISAEISFRDFPFNLYSDFKVKESSNIYAAYFDLNSEDEKRRFFNIL